MSFKRFLTPLLFVALGGCVNETAERDLQMISSAPKFADWPLKRISPDNAIWHTPSNFTVFYNGDWYLYAARLDNDRRGRGALDPILDNGPTLEFVLYATFRGSKGGVCSKSVVHTGKYSLESVRYKSHPRNVSNRGRDPDLARAIPRIDPKCTTFSQQAIN